MQIDDPLASKLRPALQRVAQNHSLHDKHLEQFNSDEDEGGFLDFSASERAHNVLLEELQSLLDPPLNEFETDLAAWYVEGRSRMYCPGTRYDMELELETHRVRRWADTEASSDTRQYLVQWDPAKGHAGQERVNIIARRNIRRRWEKLGVWNPEWGIPGRTTNPQPNDDTYTWLRKPRRYNQGESAGKRGYSRSGAGPGVAEARGWRDAQS
jgi:hypothetical protein